MSDSSRPGDSLFNTLPPQPADPTSTVRAPSGAAGDGLSIMMPPQVAPPLITTSPPPGSSTMPPGEAHERDLLLSRLRQRREGLSETQVAALFKILE